MSFEARLMISSAFLEVDVRSDDRREASLESALIANAGWMGNKSQTERFGREMQRWICGQGGRERIIDHMDRAWHSRMIPSDGKERTDPITANEGRIQETVPIQMIKWWVIMALMDTLRLVGACAATAEAEFNWCGKRPKYGSHRIHKQTMLLTRWRCSMVNAGTCGSVARRSKPWCAVEY